MSHIIPPLLHRQTGKGVADLGFGTRRIRAASGKIFYLFHGENDLDRMLFGHDFQPPFVATCFDPFDLVRSQAVLGCVTEGDFLQQFFADAFSCNAKFVVQRFSGYNP